ncbi:MAG: hypothetical protein ACK5KL_20980 [Dysgonomonas sp.]
MNVIFWNIKNKPETKTDILLKLIEDTDPDIFFIAESNQEFNLNDIDKNYVKINFKGNKRGKVVTSFIKSNIQLTNREYYFNGRIAVCVFEKNNEKIAICGVHLYSKLNESFNQHYYSGDLRKEIFKICDLYNKVLFIGDFNLLPWDIEMCSISGLNAIPWSSEIITQNFILKNNVKHYYLYNPMWNYLGDELLGSNCGAKGSYKIEKEGSLKWQFIDQIICSKGLIDKVFPNRIKIIEKINLNNQFIDILMMDNKGKYKYSDHYPIFCNIN